MNVGLIILIVLLVALAGAAVGLYFFGKRARARQSEMDAQIEATKQTVSMLIIDKKKLKIRDAGLPDAVSQNMPWYVRWQKLPVVKAKVGPQVMNLLCDERIFNDIPLKKEVKAQVSGIFISGIKGLHGKSTAKEPEKKGFFKDMMAKAREKAGSNPLK